MTTNTMIPQVALEEYLIAHGPAKATVLANAIHLSETSTRKLLKRLEGEGKVTKDGQLFAWKKVSKKAAAKDTTATASSARRDEIMQRDQLVLSFIQKLASKDDETISRNELQTALKNAGHKFSGSFVYLSLYRLHALGAIERVHVGKRAPEWRVVKG